MTPINHWQMRQEKLSETLYEAVQDKLNPNGAGPYGSTLTPQIATHALKAVLNQLANFYEKDATNNPPPHVMHDLITRRNKLGTSLPVFYIREIANPPQPLTPKQELVKNFAEELGIEEASVRILLNQYDKLSPGPEEAYMPPCTCHFGDIGTCDLHNPKLSSQA